MVLFVTIKLGASCQALSVGPGCAACSSLGSLLSAWHTKLLFLMAPRNMRLVLEPLVRPTSNMCSQGVVSCILTKLCMEAPGQRSIHRKLSLAERKQLTPPPTTHTGTSSTTAA